MNDLYTPSGSSRTLYPLNPTAISYHFDHGLNECTFVNLTNINSSLSGKLVATCFKYNHNVLATAFLSKVGDFLSCASQQNLKLTQVRWSNLGLNLPVKVNVGIANCAALPANPSFFPTQLNEERVFELGLPLNTTQTFPQNPRIAEVKKEALDFKHTLTTANHLCHKFSLQHQGNYANSLYVSCLQTEERHGMYFSKFYNPMELHVNNPILYCKPESEGSSPESIMYYYFNKNIPRNDPIDASLTFSLKIINCSDVPITSTPSIPNASPSPYQNSRALVILTLLISGLIGLN